MFIPKTEQKKTKKATPNCLCNIDSVRQLITTINKKAKNKKFDVLTDLMKETINIKSKMDAPKMPIAAIDSKY